MFFGQDHFFEELFCICIQLQNKTWKEMRATQEDFDKVSPTGGHPECCHVAGSPGSHRADGIWTDLHCGAGSCADAPQVVQGAVERGPVLA